MANRSDCPINLTGLSSSQRAYVMANRPDCPIDLTGLDPEDIDLVQKNRPDYKPGQRLNKG